MIFKIILFEVLKNKSIKNIKLQLQTSKCLFNIWYPMARQLFPYKANTSKLSVTQNNDISENWKITNLIISTDFS